MAPPLSAPARSRRTRQRALSTATILLCLGLANRVAAEPQSVDKIAKAAKDSVVTIRFTGRRASEEGLGTGFGGRSLCLTVEREAAGAELADADLAIAGPWAILVRMLGNLLGIAVREGKQADVLRHLDAILVIEPAGSARDRVMRMVTFARLDAGD